MFLAATFEKTLNARAGRSGTPSTVTRASFLAIAAPQTGIPGDSGSAHDHRARIVAETAAHVDRHVELLGELDRAVVHHAGAGRGQLEHFVVADLLDLPGLGHDAGIGRIDAVDVGVDFADVGLEQRRPRPRRSCRCRRGRAW